MRLTVAAVVMASISIASPLRAAWKDFQVELGPEAGVTLQTDQYVAGARLAAGLRDVPFVQVDTGLLAGIGADFYSVRPGLHVRGVLSLDAFHVDAIGGASVLVFWPRGDFARFCEKTRIDCSDSALGADLGLGVGYRPLMAEAIFGTGELPLWTFTVGARFEL